MMITINSNLIDDDNDDDDDVNDVSGAKLVPALARTTWTQPPLLPEKPPAGDISSDLYRLSCLDI